MELTPLISFLLSFSSSRLLLLPLVRCWASTSLSFSLPHALSLSLSKPQQWNMGHNANQPLIHSLSLSLYSYKLEKLLLTSDWSHKRETNFASQCSSLTFPPPVLLIPLSGPKWGHQHSCNHNTTIIPFFSSGYTRNPSQPSVMLAVIFLTPSRTTVVLNQADIGH